MLRQSWGKFLSLLSNMPNQGHKKKDRQKKKKKKGGEQGRDRTVEEKENTTD